jgi:hypothetical protein
VVVTWTVVIYLVVGGPSIVIDGITTEDTCYFIGENYQEHIDARAKFKCSKVVTKRDVPPHRRDR